MFVMLLISSSLPLLILVRSSMSCLMLLSFISRFLISLSFFPMVSILSRKLLRMSLRLLTLSDIPVWLLTSDWSLVSINCIFSGTEFDSSLLIFILKEKPQELYFFNKILETAQGDVGPEGFSIVEVYVQIGMGHGSRVYWRNGLCLHSPELML